MNDGWANLFFAAVPNTNAATVIARKAIRPISELPKAAMNWSQRPPEDKITWAPGGGVTIGKTNSSSDQKIKCKKIYSRLRVSSDSGLF